MDGLRQQLNRALYLGLNNYEAHYAAYQAGGFYKKHLDLFKGKRNRIVPICSVSDAGLAGT